MIKSKIKISLAASVFLLIPTLIFAAGISQSYEKLANPLPPTELVCLTAVCELKSFFILVVRDILQLIPVVSVMVIVAAGFKMVSSAGNPEKLAEAKRMLLWAILGLVAAFLSFSIVAIVRNLIGVQ